MNTNSADMTFADCDPSGQESVHGVVSGRSLAHDAAFGKDGALTPRLTTELTSGSEADLLNEALALADNDEERTEIYESIGELLAFQLGEPKRGIYFFERALDLTPMSCRSLNGLERAYELLGQPRMVVETLEKRFSSGLRSSADAADVLSRLANVLDKGVGDWEGAIRRLWQVLSLQPNHGWAFSRVVELTSRVEQWNEFVGQCEDLVSGLTDAEDRNQFRTWVNHALWEAGHGELAVMFLERCLGDWECVEDTTLMLDADIERWARLQESNEQRVVLADDGEECGQVVEFHLQRALDLDALGAPVSMIRSYLARVVFLDCDNVAAWEALQGIALREGAVRRAAFCLMERVHRETQDTERAALYLELGMIWENRPEGYEHAYAAFRLALQVDPNNELARRALRRISGARLSA